MAAAMACELCDLAAAAARPEGAPGVVYRDAQLLVLMVDDANYPGFCRVVWNGHVREMSDLDDASRLRVNDAVWRVEKAVREVLGPHKVNVASLGNMTPHLHWHVIPRFEDDAHFPNPVWASAVRSTDPALLAARRALLPRLAEAIRSHLAAHGASA
jgi:diadenosine tetraphosphate (Ap4A) HIT family hydrolase